MGVVSLMDAIMGTHVDLKGLETGLQKAEKMAEEALKKIQGQFGLLGIGIATAFAGTVLVAMEKAIKTTAEWGLEMEHLSNRMGVTVREASILVGTMERFGVNAGLGARAMQMLSTQVKQTQESLDPFNTKLGKTLGTLRDSNGQYLNMSQVIDLVRQKVSGATTDTEKLQISTTLLGSRIGGQLVPWLKMSNEEWTKQRASVEASLGPVEKAAELALAYKQATEALEQSMRGLQVSIGTELLPTLIKLIDATDKWISRNQTAFRNLGSAIADIGHPLKFLKETFVETVGMLGQFDEYLGLMKKGTTGDWLSGRKDQEMFDQVHLENQRKLALVEEQREQANRKQKELTEKQEKELVASVRERVSLEEKSVALGMGGSGLKGAVNDALTKLEEQRKLLQSELAQEVDPNQRLIKETQIMKNRIEAVEIVRKSDEALYKHEEEAIKHLTGLRLTGVETEIAFRKQKAAEMLGKGDVFGAAGEIVKARDLAVKQADQTMEFVKKIRVVSLQSEIDYQKEKLQLAKGNAEEEMKILSEVANLDKQLYDQRLEFALRYTQNTIDAYQKMMKVTGQTPTEGGGDQTFAQAGRDAERAQFQQARTLRDIAAHGGTAEARNLAVQQAQEIYKEIESRQKTGSSVSEGLREVGVAARELLRAASGGEEVRAPGGPSPTIGSLLSPSEGLATSTLARGSDIPRLDTSFTDMAIRVRDVLLSATSYVQGFSTALQTAGQKLASQFGVAYSPGTGPGGGTSSLPTQGSGVLSTNQQNLTVAPGGTPTAPSPQIGVGSVASSDIAVQLKAVEDAIREGNREMIDNLNNNSVANAESLQQALTDLLANRPQNTKVEVSVDPNSGELLARYLVTEISQ